MIKEVMQYLGNWTKLLFKVIGAAIFAAGGVFMIGERLEIGRLEAEAVCRVCPDPAGCMQVRGYLSSAPHYPDLTRRMIGSYTRTVGSLLGANYSLAGMLLSASFVLLASCSDYNDARSAYAGGRHQEAFVKLLKLAKEGHLKAQYEVAMMLNNGIGVAKDKEEAWNWFVRAAKAGNIDAQVELGAHYEAGADGQPNGIMAAQWWKTAARNGSGVAAFNLATMYSRTNQRWAFEGRVLSR
ncbi:MAG: sel1 repeat family protein [Betaproteobacteria bacterium]|nr:sel1 repeat family protein [Betaproteobacteria bacterium]